MHKNNEKLGSYITYSRQWKPPLRQGARALLQAGDRAVDRDERLERKYNSTMK